ncbi:class I SAM-dependent methyltransferase [Cryptosporangium phraense]|uniref:Class I SAM-dependent methyltransferase n=1 Tax=Cryptosporangium phraense TaxID=2593070 RepID=A0A545AR37_9ACTN|nr:class I SAM-dependent methyltransferase [Cryptosporangium phraense]TQS43799.1 class I SAM-dependent methyltransferase [Cryptosporangium phraense]
MTVSGIFEDRAYVTAFERNRYVAAHRAEEYAAEAIKEAPDVAHLEVLDVGAGTGQFAGPLHRAAASRSSSHQIILLDNSTEMASHLRTASAELGPSVRAVTDDFWHYRNSASDVHVTLFSESIHLLGDLDKVIAAVAGFSAPRGVLALRIATREQVHARPWYQWYPDALAIDLMRHPSKAELMKYLHDAGYDAYSREADESRVMSAHELGEMLEAQSFSALRLMDGHAFGEGVRRMRKDLRRAGDVHFDYRLTWTIARLREGNGG